MKCDESKEKKTNKKPATTKTTRNVTICTIYVDRVQKKTYTHIENEKGHVCTCLNTLLCVKNIQRADNNKKKYVTYKAHTRTHTFLLLPYQTKVFCNGKNETGNSWAWAYIHKHLYFTDGTEFKMRNEKFRYERNKRLNRLHFIFVRIHVVKGKRP